MCLCVLFLLSAERAEAGVVNCPTALKLNPSWAQSGAIGLLCDRNRRQRLGLPVRADQL